MRIYRKAGRQACHFFASVAIVALMTIVSPTHDLQAAPLLAPSFFGSTESRSSDIAPFTKWTSALSRFATEAASVAKESCRAGNRVRCQYDQWGRFLAEVKDKSRWQQLIAVNQYMNARDYVSDRRNWGVSDYWATPGEFLTGSGDCEDYAIAKFLSLRALGWADEDLRVVAVKDHTLGSGHAVVVASHAGRTWLLDNQLDKVVPTTDVSHYEVVYSINEHHWWRHRSETH